MHKINLALICFTQGALDSYSGEARWIVFIMLQNALLLFKLFVSGFFEDMPPEVQMQIDRNDFLVSKLLYDKKDDNREDALHATEKHSANIIINQSDEDWVLPDEIEEVEVEINGMTR